MTLWGEVLRDDILSSRNSETNCSAAHPSARGITRTLSHSISQQSLKIARSHLVRLLCKPIIPCMAPADPVTSSEQASVGWELQASPVTGQQLASHMRPSPEGEVITFLLFDFIYHYRVCKHIPGREGNSLSFLESRPRESTKTNTFWLPMFFRL